MSALYMIVGTLVALGVLVTFHEFGHFWVARRCGVKVLRFSVGFGTPLVRWHDRHGTEFVVAAIPLGGYVKMLDEREAEVPAHLLEQSFNRKTVRQRIAIVAAGPIANFLLAILFFWVVALLGSQQVRPVIGSVAPESLAAQAGLEAGQELLAVDGEPVTGWNGVNLQLVRRLGESGTLEVRVQEKGSNVDSTHQVRLDGWLKGEDNPDPIASLGIRPWRPALPPVLAELDPKGPAQAAGLKLGDRLQSIDGIAVDDWQQVVDSVRARPGAARPAQGAARRRSAGCCPGTGGARRGQGPERLHGGGGRRYRMAGGNAPRSELRTAGGGGSGAFPNLDHEPANARLHKENVARRALGKKLERADNHC